MRILRVGLALTGLLISAATSAQHQVRIGNGSEGNLADMVRPAPNEMLLTVRGRGLQVSKPDFATQLITLVTTGSDNSAAVTANQQLIARVRRIVADIGIDLSAVQNLPVDATSRFGFLGNAAIEPEEIPATPSRKTTASYASSSMLVRLTDMGKLEALRMRLRAIAEVNLANPTYGLDDNSMAKRAAIDQALAKARVDAAIYSKAMNMKVDRIVAVRDVAGSFAGDSLMEMFTERGQMPGSGVRTEVTIEVDVVFKPQ